MIGISIKSHIGIGDALQFSSLPENVFRATGEKVVDLSKPWFFDHNPYVSRDPEDLTKINMQREMWNFPPQYEYPFPRGNGLAALKKDRPAVYLSNAEIWSSLFDIPCVMNRPRLYKHEDFEFRYRKNILLHVDGRSHGLMPDHVIDHIIKKYKNTGYLFQIGTSNVDLGIAKIPTPTLWELAELISRARMLIGVDSGPSWIAACYPDVIVKKLRTKPLPAEDYFPEWIPLEIRNIHSHWDDRCHMIYNETEKDLGFTWSYKRI